MKKINVALISPNKNAYSETFIQAHKANIDANVKYLYQGTLPEMAEDEGLLVHYGFFNRVRRKLNNYFKISALNFHEKRLADYFKRHKIDLAFAEFGMTGADILNVCRSCNIPLVVHFHGLDAYMTHLLDTYGKKYLNMFDYASTVIVVSNHMLAQLKSLGCPLDKLLLNPCGPSDAFFDVNSDFSQKTFISIGRFVAKKAPHITIRAFAKVLEKHPDATLKMVGDGPLLADCQQLVQDFGISKNVIFFGVQDRGVIQKLFGESLAFVQHSVTAESGDREGTPVGVLEASASGLPVIATRHAGIPDVIIHETTGFLTEEYDEASMTKHMIFILDNPEIAKTMGTAGKIRIKENFSLTTHISKINNAIKTVATKFA